MNKITGNYENIRTIPMPEDNLDIVPQEGSEEGTSNSPSISSSNRSREEYNSTHIGKFTFPEQIVEEQALKKCIEIFTPKLSESLSLAVGSSIRLSKIYIMDRLARQMFYEIAQKSGADSLYLSTKLDPRYQVEDNFVITIEQESKLFFLDTPFGRRQIKNSKDRKDLLRSDIVNRCCKSREETLCAVVLAVIEIGKRIFTPNRVVKTNTYIKFEDYISKEWHRVPMDQLDEIDERLGVHYNPKEEPIAYRRDPPLFKSFQINDIEKRLRSRRQL